MQNSSIDSLIAATRVELNARLDALEHTMKLALGTARISSQATAPADAPAAPAAPTGWSCPGNLAAGTPCKSNNPLPFSSRTRINGGMHLLCAACRKDAKRTMSSALPPAEKKSRKKQKPQEEEEAAPVEAPAAAEEMEVDEDEEEVEEAPVLRPTDTPAEDDEDDFAG